ncbi:hypothetical protein [Formosa algae]|uniref:Bacterial mobilisation domain-containing protein n=2 Tax=Formosa algae TaxID=225843 RepID=A0A9X1CB52_9FLAO|nr:hypothetical protein [Formosa algae]MBP1838774.1 hypothetical protein [Formosa algae]MDQ0335274.1 hypothetical protein [Formosa algae]PNW27232.1 hypothetical protein BKP44_14165 [Formosa algae]
MKEKKIKTKPINKRVHFVISEERKNKWLELAKEEYSSLTDFIITRVEGNITRYDIKTIEGLFEKMGGNRNKVESNINQVTRIINVAQNINEENMLRFLELFSEYSRKVEKQNKIITKVYKKLNS